MENLMTAEEVASYLHLCKKTVYSLAKQGAIPSTTLGTNVRFSRAEIDKLLKTTAPNPKQFLVIDDNPAITRMIKQVLGSRGHFTLTAETGKEGVELVRECEFDKIFLDLRMPDIDGAETLRLIREINPKVPVVVITGYPDPEITERAIKYGVAGILEKPFNLADIVEAIGT